MKKALILSFALLLALAVGCRKKDEFKPSKFAGQLYSGQSLQTVERKLNLNPGDWKIIEDQRPLSSDPRPPFRILTISKADFPLLGSAGKDLVMTFYNDRLMTVQFYPYDIQAFKSALASDGTVLSAANDARIEPSTRVWLGKDDDGKLYYGFIDKSLQAEYNDWLKKYAGQ